MIFLPAHPASFTHKVPGCNGIANLSCSGLISLQLDPYIWKTASPRTHRPKIVNESLLKFFFHSVEHRQ